MDSKRPGSGFFYHDVYMDLLNAMRMNDENKFNQILTGENLDVNKVYDRAPDVGTILDFCCEEANRSHYIATLLNRGANPDLINSRTKKGPIHQLAQRDYVESMQVLLDHKATDPNLLDHTGSTALHIACKKNNLEMIQTILNHPDTNPNIINRKGYAPLHIILDKEPSEDFAEAVKLIITHPKIDLSLTNYDGEDLRQLIEESYPELVLPAPGASNAEVDVSKLFQMLRRDQCGQFLEHVRGNKAVLEGDDSSFTFLQYCCSYGLDGVAQALLQEGVDPNGTCPNNVYPPLMIACRKGYVTIVGMLVDSKRTTFDPVNSETVLHCLVNGGYDKEALGESNIERDHLKCLTYILKTVPQGRIDLNFRDKNGNTALHYAAKMGDHNMVLEILAAGAYIGVCNKRNEPACADIAFSTMLRHLNNCISTNEKMPRDEMYALIFNYGCMVPFKKIEEDAKPLSSSTDNFIQVPVSKYGGNALYRSGETDPLIYISQNSELRPLLTHPIFTSYLHLKWHKLQPYYFINLIFYLVFWLSLTYYILGVFVDAPPRANSTSTDNMENTFNGSSAFIAWSLVLLLLLVLVIREAAQLLISPKRYVTNSENWLELGIILVTCLILACGDCSSIKHPLSAVGILTSWVELVLLIGKHPTLSTNIEMLKTVSWTFFKFLAWYSILIVAFALCFFTLFKDGSDDDNPFQQPFVSIFKTIVMLTGEFDSSSIPFVVYPVTSHILFVLFVFLIAIVLLNLLNGLAVNDTQLIKAEAELVAYISQAKLVSQIEGKLSKKFNCWGVFRESFNFSDAINMFKDIPDGRIYVYPNQWNRTELDDLHCGKYPRPAESEAQCYDLKSIFMDVRITRAARGILNDREHEKSERENLAMVTELESEIRSLLKDFKESLREYKEINARMNQQYSRY